MTRTPGGPLRFAVWMLVSFILGIVTALLFMIGERGRVRVDRDSPAPVQATQGREQAAPSPPATNIQPVRNPTPQMAHGPADVDAALDDLRDRDLKVPVKDVSRDDLRDSFKEARDKIRAHEAVDILAPRHTAVLAVEDGTIAKLFTSVRGGLTIYQFDPSQTYAYYYAHLDGYVWGLAEGDRVKRGETIGYVGTTGNAPESTPHLHFQIFLLTAEKQWWKGTAINPYDVWKK
jgi:murein DD-endopeptidase MepM/ murein hydrolase activator NlpD